MSTLQRHPFPVVAWFDRVVALSFAFPEKALRPLVPNGLEIDTYEGLGFVTAALVWTRRLRPAGFPEALGQDSFFVGYRIFTRLNDGGRRLRGLRILRSETDKKRMVIFGNLMTGYQYRHVNVAIKENNGITRVTTALSDGVQTLDTTFCHRDEAPGLPEGSPFPDWRTARRFAGPMPFTFSQQEDGSFIVIEGNRETWTPRPIRVDEWKVAMFEDSPLKEYTPRLTNAFMVENVDYRWKKGRIVRPGGEP